MIEIFFATFASLFSIVNPLGAVPLFLALTSNDTLKERHRTIIETSIFFILILLSFLFLGSYILSFFGISIHAMRIAGGIVIFLSGFNLLSGEIGKKRVSAASRQEAMERHDISFSPMAMPMLSGPGSISLMVSLGTEAGDWNRILIISAAVLLTGVVVYFILRLSPLLFRAIGVSGLNALTRIMGFLVMTLGVQYVIAGVATLVQDIL